jgi:predicted AAA+ superfamily ATPase
LESLSYREFVRFQALSEEEAEAPERVRSRIPNLLDRYLAVGGFPEYVGSEDYPRVRERLRADIVERAILRDLAPLGLDLPRVKALFVYLVQESGGLFNASKRAGDLDADRRSVAEWLRRVEETALLVSLPQYLIHAAARVRASPKVYAADPGLIAAFTPAPGGGGEVRSQLFEAAAFRHLREVARKRGGDLYYYRDHEGLEIDFLLLTDRQPVAVEVTSAGQPKGAKTARLLAAAERVGARQVLLVHGGLADDEQGRTSAGLRKMTLEQFLWAGLPALDEAP